MNIRSRIQRVRRRLANRRRARSLTDYRSAISDIRLSMQAEATKSTTRYVVENMYTVQSVDTWQGVHDVAISNVKIEDGLVVEFGVFSGRTINYIANGRPWKVDGFDSFDGLPNAWRDGYPAKAFARDTLPTVSSNVSLHVGLFETAIPKFLGDLIGDKAPISYMHIDCDLYASTKCIFDLMGDRIVAGTVIVFDEYFNYSGWEQGEFRAFQEFLKRRKLSFKYLTYNHEHQQVAVLIC